MARRVSREFAPLPDPAPLPSEPQPPRAEQERCLSAACLDACAIIAVSAVGAGFLVIPYSIVGRAAARTSGAAQYPSSDF